MPGAAHAPASPPSPEVRKAVRELLAASSGYQDQDPDTRRAIAGALVRIADTALALAAQERAVDGLHAGTREGTPAAPRSPLARAQDAGSSFSGVAASKVAATTSQILNAVSFPRFVTELINGVFKAMLDTNQQQLRSYLELIQNVAASTEGFADANIGVSGAREWLAQRFPDNFVVHGGETDDFDTPPSEMSPDERAAAQAERDADTRLALRPGAAMPSEAALRTALGLGPQDTVSAGNPENLVPLARASLARNRQQMLSTMVMLGLQRIVIESGRLNAAMRFHIDTRSAAAEDRGSSFDARHTSSANIGAKFGPWGVDATIQNTIGYVSTQRTQTTEEMNTDLDLNSSVELMFRTDQVDLDRLAGGPAQQRIRLNALNPEAELRAASADRQARRAGQSEAEAGRRKELGASIGALTPLPLAAATPPPRPAAKPATTPPAAAPGPTGPATATPGAAAPGPTQTATAAPGAAAPAAAPARPPAAVSRS